MKSRNGSGMMLKRCSENLRYVRWVNEGKFITLDKIAKPDTFRGEAPKEEKD